MRSPGELAQTTRTASLTPLANGDRRPAPRRPHGPPAVVAWKLTQCFATGTAFGIRSAPPRAGPLNLIGGHRAGGPHDGVSTALEPWAALKQTECLAMKKVFTTGQVAKICKVAPRTVSKWFDSGRLKGYRIPGSQDRRIPREQLIRFLKEHGMPLGELEEEEWHKVLLIGTEKLFNDRIKEILPEDDDFKFETANSGFEAGILAGSFHPDTIIIDLGLGPQRVDPDHRNLRKDEAYATTLIVGLASEDEAAPEQLAQYGFNDIFKKPFDLALLGEKIKSIADAKRED